MSLTTVRASSDLLENVMDRGEGGGGEHADCVR